MAESSSQNPSSPNIKKEPETQEIPESPNPFLPEDLILKLNKKTREKVVPYPRFISLLLEYMMPKYENEELTLNPTQVFSVHNWALKPNKHEGPPFTNHMKAICNVDMPVESIALTTSSKTKMKFDQGKSPSHPSASTPVVGEMHKEAQQAAGGPTSLGATSEDEAHPQLRCDALADSTAKADPRISAPNDFLLELQCMDEGTQNYLLDHLFAGTNPSILVDQTISARDGLKTIHTDLVTN
ncbi:hypothetical protein Tco_0468012 [Tanacetum coccineum]